MLSVLIFHSPLKFLNMSPAQMCGRFDRPALTNNARGQPHARPFRKRRPGRRKQLKTNGTGFRRGRGRPVEVQLSLTRGLTATRPTVNSGKELKFGNDPAPAGRTGGLHSVSRGALRARLCLAQSSQFGKSFRSLSPECEIRHIPGTNPRLGESDHAFRTTERRGEPDAYFHLRRLGYVIVARNHRAPRQPGEIKLIGRSAELPGFD
jgi:hypothetical protein